jgi:hypothetical protein
LIFPDYFDGDAPLIEAKGYFAHVTIETENARFRPVFYDQERFAQESPTRSPQRVCTRRRMSLSSRVSLALPSRRQLLRCARVASAD